MLDVQVITPNMGADPLVPTSLPSFSPMIFQWDWNTCFPRNYSARLGYRLLGLTSNESFDGSFQHLIELGVGANF